MNVSYRLGVPSHLYEVKMFYNENVKPPGKPDDLALHTWHRDLLSRDMEIVAAIRREDIGRIQWCGVNGAWVNVDKTSKVYLESGLW